MALNIGERLIYLLEVNSMRQKEAADKLDIKIPTFNGYVNNIREPNIETLIKIADFFNVTVDFLIGHNTLNDNEKIDIIPVNSRIEHLDEGLNSFVNDPDNKIFIEMAREIKHKLIIEGYGKLNT
jgi:transcriptional regulator with XRE-family HTH domain